MIPSDDNERDGLTYRLGQSARRESSNRPTFHEEPISAALQHLKPLTEEQPETVVTGDPDQKACSAMNPSRKLIAQWSQLKTLRHKMLTLRMQVREQGSFCAQQRQHGSKILDELVTKFKSGLEQNSTMAIYGSLLKLYEQLQDNQRELDVQEENTNLLVNRLSSLEYQYGQNEGRLFESLQNEVFGSSLEPARETPPLLDDVTDYLASKDSSTSMHPILQEYYDRTGDIGVWQDRLVDLELAQRKAAISRETRANAGQAVFPSDIDFYDEYRQKRESILMEIALAKADSKRLRGECKALNLELSESESSAGGTEGRLPYQSNNGPPKRVESSRESQDVQISDINLLRTGHSAAKDRIDHWLGEVESEGMTNSPLQNDSTQPPSSAAQSLHIGNGPSINQLSGKKQRSASISAVNSSDTAATSPPISPVHGVRLERRPRTASSDSLIRPS